MSTPSYVLTLRLKPEKWQQDKLNTLFEIARKMYNSSPLMAHGNYFIRRVVS